MPSKSLTGHSAKASITSFSIRLNASMTSLSSISLLAFVALERISSGVMGGGTGGL